MNVIDLSHRIHSEMTMFPGDRSPVIRAQLNHANDGCQVSQLEIGAHTGTHIDAPFHFFADRVGIDAVPVDRLIGPGVLIDATQLSAGQAIGPETLAPYNDFFSTGDFAVFRTGWDRFYLSDDYFRHPYLTPECARHLVGLSVSLVGIDAMSVDPTPEPEAATDSENITSEIDHSFPAHEILLGNDILLVENLRGLDQLTGLTGQYSFLPLKIKAGDGSPIRAVFMTSA